MDAIDLLAWFEKLGARPITHSFIVIHRDDVSRLRQAITRGALTRLRHNIARRHRKAT